MKTVNQKTLLSAGVAIVMTFAAWLPASASAADETKPMKPMKGGEHLSMLDDTDNPAPAKGKTMMDGKMMAGCQEMMQQRHKMMAEMKVQDAELTEQVAKMNSAPEDKKMGLMANILTRMVEQRTVMNVRMEKMQARMMQHMMGHMQMGKESMSQCPMMKGMKGMKGMDEKSADAHNEHQAEQK